MANPLRLFLFDRSGDETPLRGAFEKVHGVLILGSSSSWEELRDWLCHGSCDVVGISLDVEGSVDLETVQRIVELAPACSIIGISRQTDPSSIIGAMRAGCTQFVCWPIEQRDLHDAVQRIRATRVVPVQATKRICVIGASGGAGATTIACNMAIELADVSRQSCVLVDLNLEFGDVACAFNCQPTFSVSDVCEEGVEIDRVLLSKALYEGPCNISILARPGKLEDARKVSPERVQEMLRVMGEMKPFIIIDLPRYFSLTSAAAVREADYILIITQLSVPFIRNASQMYKSLLDMGAAEETIQIVLNRCKSADERITLEDVAGHFGKEVFAAIPNDYRSVQTSLDLGHPIKADCPNTPARRAIRQLARKIIDPNAWTGTKERRKSTTRGGLLSRLFS